MVLCKGFFFFFLGGGKLFDYYKSLLGLICELGPVWQFSIYLFIFMGKERPRNSCNVLLLIVYFLCF